LTTSRNGVESYQDRSAVVNRGDGLDIKLDLVKCAASLPGIPASVFSAGRNWFLNVQVPTSSTATWIDLLRIVTSGHTDFLQFDTNHDGASDGVKVNYGRDALGYDADQDGVSNTIDPDDTIPSWAPALRVYSNDYTKRMEISFQDLAVPISAMSVVARYNATGQQHDLSTTYQNAATWTVNPNQYNQFPDALDVHWRDVYGTQGTVTYYMGPQDTAVFVPKAIVSQTTDAASRQSISMSVSFAGMPPDRSAIAFGTATLYADAYEGKAYQGALMSVIGTPLFARDALGYFAAAGRAMAATWSAVSGWFVKACAVVAQSVADTVENVANGFHFVVLYTRVFAGVVAADLNKVMTQGKVYLDDAGTVFLITVNAAGQAVVAGTKATGDGVLVVANVIVHPVYDAASLINEITNIGYGYHCGGGVFSFTENPIDELDASCFIHDRCLFAAKISFGVRTPFVRDSRAMTCNGVLINNAGNAVCDNPTGAPIMTPIPENGQDGVYKLPNPPPAGERITVRHLYDISPCVAQRIGILDVFGLGRAAALMSLVVPT
jgi:hypothetical protein